MKRSLTVILSMLLCAAAVFSCYPYIKSTEAFGSIVSGLDFLKEDDREEEETTTAPDTTASETDAQTTAAPDTTAATTPPETTKVPETTVPETTVPETTAPPVTQPPVTAPPVTQPPETEPPRDYVPPVPVSPSEFDNSLFIGDSRTLGLLYYGGLGNADVFATKGMTAARALSETVEVKSCGATKLEPLLTGKKYERVYIMLGLNEIGGTLEGIKRNYKILFEKVTGLQPEAQIYVCANLRITYSRSQVDSIYNNTRLNDINAYIASLANGNNVKYIDVNEIFNDSKGAFGAAYTTDDFHPMPKYYKQWTQWLGTVT